MLKILIIDDDSNFTNQTRAFLTRQGYQVDECASVEDAHEVFDGSFDMALVEPAMQGGGGFEFIESLRAHSSDPIVIAVSLLGDFGSKQRAYRLGADDYVVKPVSPDELLLHIGALFRRVEHVYDRTLTVGSLAMDIVEHAAYLNGKEVPLTVREFDLLYNFLSNPKATFSRARLMDEFWPSSAAIEPRTVDVYITKLRNKFSTCSDFEIVTVHGLGYKAVLKEDTSSEG